MSKPQIKFYFDIVSPFAYMAFYITRHSSTFKACDITYIPAFLGGIMKACDNRAPLNIKNKDKWIELERTRWAKQFNIPIGSPPEGFPVLTLTIQRALCALTLVDAAKLPLAVEALYQAFWVERNAALVNKPEGLAKLLGGVLGEAVAKEVMQKSTSDEAKQLLNKNSDAALAEGCFGMPYLVATNSKGETEAFWGFDHLGQVIEHLGLEREREGGWRAML